MERNFLDILILQYYLFKCNIIFTLKRTNQILKNE